jgi:glycosyltransferase involved in cell wall biosynthesis
VLTIGVDARELLGDATGVGRYLGELLVRWTARSDAANRHFVLFAPEDIPLPLPTGTTDRRILGGGGRGTWWEQTSLRAAVGREPLDVFFAPAYTAPLGIQAPLALTIHDVSFLAHPEWFRPRERLRRRFVTGRSARAARVVFTDSAFSRDEIRRHLAIDSARLQVVPPGVSVRQPPGATAPPREPLVLFVGSLFNRRRLPDLIEAFSRATRDLPAARLVIVGSDRTWPRQDLGAAAAAHGVASRVDLRSYVSDAELASLYARASAFAFLSEYEGFGLTPLEALSAGVPIVVLDTPVAREVYGQAAIYVSPADAVGGAAAALRTLVTAGGGTHATVAHAADLLARYSWDRAAETTLAGIEAVARGSGR